jgi:hypothetical protein
MFSANSRLEPLNSTRCTQLSQYSRGEVSCRIGETGARILKHLLEPEKSTFRKELSFQRLESTIGLLQATVFDYDRKDYFL